ncbi:unnamed protein product [Paramecium primaurelia]|uniref:Hyaluronan/mRNA-binding protein domain-containing protein n=1 Tax=Paramecium primaurelia TaxID=5886 RepID=A0A8S1LB69_PARPR|nr:unnamed protein product [Paramecium primaurelia]
MSTNMFNVLNISDDEDSKTQQTQQKTQQQQAKKNKQKREQEQVIPLDQVKKESTQHHNPAPKQKGLTADPHPKDRHSGTGIGKELRKEGGGRRNWGNYKDDLKQEKYQGAIEGKEAPQEQNTEQQGEEQQPQENVPQAPAEKTLADYYQARGVNVEEVLKNQKQKVQPVVKIDEEALKKEKLQVMRTREDEKREKEQKATKKSSGQQQQGYRSEMSTEGQQYFGFTNDTRRNDRNEKNDRNDRKDNNNYNKGQKKQQQPNNGVQFDDKDFPSL